jgi:hypothetical protein
MEMEDGINEPLGSAMVWMDLAGIHGRYGGRGWLGAGMWQRLSLGQDELAVAGQAQAVFRLAMQQDGFPPTRQQRLDRDTRRWLDGTGG